MSTYAIGGSSFAAFLNQSGGNTEAVPGPGFVNETGNTSVGPATGSIVFTGFAPTTTTNVAVSPATGSIVFTGFAPSVSATVTPGAGSIVFTGFAPSLPVTVAPATGSVLFTGFVPTVVKLAAGGFFHPVF